MKKSFELGRTVITSHAMNVLNQGDVFDALKRHAICDWGDVCPEDKLTNDEALQCGDSILSVYRDSLGTKFWIITEADRSVTTILLPEDY